MRKFLYENLPMYAIAGGGSGPGNITQIDQPLDQMDDLNPGDDQTGGNPGGDNISLDQPDDLARLFDEQGEGDDEDDDAPADDDSGTDDQPDDDAPVDDNQQRNRQQTQGQKAAVAASKKLAEDIAALALGQDIIPENFDPGNREQLVGVLNTAQRNAVQNTLKLLLPVISMSMKAQRDSILGDVATRISGNNTQNQVQAMLEASIPEVRDPGVGPIIRTIFKQAQIRHPKKPAEAIAATKKALGALGVKLGAARGNDDTLPAGVIRQQRQQGGNQGSGNLDAFFNIPAPRSNPVQRRMAQK